MEMSSLTVLEVRPRPRSGQALLAVLGILWLQSQILCLQYYTQWVSASVSPRHTP